MGNIRKNQQKIVADKKIRHRNFGVHSKHECGYDTCPINGMMVRQNSELMEICIRFAGDKNKYAAKDKSVRRKSERKNEQQIIKSELKNE